jgi:hypothetical protein
VHRGHDGETFLAPERVDELEDLLLVPDVERGRRLVEQEDRRRLRQCPADHGALELAAAQGAELTVGKCDEVEPSERGGRGGAVLVALLGEGRQVWRPTEQHVLRNRHRCGHHRRLWNERHELRHRAAAHPVEAASVQAGLPAEPDRAGEDAEQRGLARAVRSEDRHPFAVRHLERDAVDDRLAARGDRDRVERDRAHAELLVVRSTSAKNGAPTNAVTTPIGSSAGEMIVRARTSASTRNAAPTTTDSGRMTR